jgi:hypothetical protein
MINEAWMVEAAALLRLIQNRHIQSQEQVSYRGYRYTTTNKGFVAIFLKTTSATELVAFPKKLRYLYL